MSDEDIWRLQRGGHDPQKVYAAFHKAAHHEGQPTVLLVKTVKGFGMGKSGEGKNTAHQTKKLVDEDVKAFRDRWDIPIPDDKLGDIKVPDIGDFKDVEVIEVLVKPGDTIQAEQSLVTVESDKASMEIPSSAAGVVKEVSVKLGDKVSEGSLLLMLEAKAAAPASAPRAAPAAPRLRRQPAAARRRAGARRTGIAAAVGGRGERRRVDVVVPDIGDFDEVAVIEVLVKPGDTRRGRAEPRSRSRATRRRWRFRRRRRRRQGAEGQGRRQGLEGQR